MTKCADQRAADGSAAAHERRATDDHRGDRVELEGLTGLRRRRMLSSEAMIRTDIAAQTPEIM